MYALPIGYTYSGYIPSSEYETMNGIEKEQAMLQAAVLDNGLEGFSSIKTASDYQLIDYDITDMSGIQLTNNHIEMTNISNKIDLQANIPDNCEIYLYISGAEVDKKFESLSISATRTMGTCSVSKSTILRSLKYNWPSLQDDVAFNLGTGYVDENTIELSFDRISSFDFDAIQVIAVPMDSYTKYAEDLGEYVLENVTVKTDQISGTISLPEARILQFSVPYSDGWKAYVDGEEVSVVKSDVMYMAIPVSAGDHTVELYYKTPYLKIGIIVSIATAVLYTIYEIIQYRRKHKGVQKNG